MKLRNKKTGEIVDNGYIRETHDFQLDGQKYVLAVFRANGHRPPERVSGVYTSLAELNEDWEDVPEEPKKWYTINKFDGSVLTITDSECAWTDKDKESIAELGLKFETKEEAEKAVEKLKAWKRLKDKGFKFKKINSHDGTISFFMPMRAEVVDDDAPYGVRDDFAEDDKTDLQMLFGGEE